MSDKKPPAKDTSKPSFVPRDSIFEQRTGQKGADNGGLTIGDVPSDVEQVTALARDLSRFLRKPKL